MSYKEFLLQIREVVSEKLGEEYSVTSKKVLKNNSVELDSLVIGHKEDCVFPTIYVNQYYPFLKSGKSVDEIADIIVNIFHYSRKNMPAERMSKDGFSDARGRIVYRLVNYLQNRELLKEGPYMRVEDLAVVFYYLVDCSENGAASIRITYDNIGMFGVTAEELPKIAEENTPQFFPASLDRIGEVLIRLMKQKRAGHAPDPDEEEEFCRQLEKLSQIDEDTDSGMYVLSNSTGCFGATCLLYQGMQDIIRDRIGEDYFILPSSVNEVIILGKSLAASMEDLEVMVGAVNAEHVPDEEVLSDMVYSYPECSFSAGKLYVSEEQK